MKISREDLLDYYYDMLGSLDEEYEDNVVSYEEDGECCFFHYDSWRKLLILDDYSNNKATKTLVIPPQFDVLNITFYSNMTFNTVDLSNIKYVTERCDLEHIKRLKKIIGLNLIHTCRIKEDCSGLMNVQFCILYNQLATRDFVLDCLFKNKSLTLVVDMTKIQFFAGWKLYQNFSFPTEYNRLKLEIVNGSTILTHRLKEGTIGYDTIIKYM